MSLAPAGPPIFNYVESDPTKTEPTLRSLPSVVNRVNSIYKITYKIISKKSGAIEQRSSTDGLFE